MMATDVFAVKDMFYPLVTEVCYYNPFIRPIRGTKILQAIKLCFHSELGNWFSLEVVNYGRFSLN